MSSHSALFCLLTLHTGHPVRRTNSPFFKRKKELPILKTYKSCKQMKIINLFWSLRLPGHCTTKLISQVWNGLWGQSIQIIWDRTKVTSPLNYVLVTKAENVNEYKRVGTLEERTTSTNGLGFVARSTN